MAKVLVNGCELPLRHHSMSERFEVRCIVSMSIVKPYEIVANVKDGKSKKYPQP